MKQKKVFCQTTSYRSGSNSIGGGGDDGSGNISGETTSVHGAHRNLTAW
jgi:hypothetical protein